MSLFKKNVENEVFEPPVLSDSIGGGVRCYLDMCKLFALLEFIVGLLNLLCIWNVLSSLL